MIKDLNELVKILDSKVEPMVKAIEKADPSTKDYETLINNFASTMALSSSINRTLLDVVTRAKELKEEGENNNESNN